MGGFHGTTDACVSDSARALSGSSMKNVEYFASRCTALLILGGLAAGAGCSGGSSSSANPGSPSGGGSGSTCRTYPTAASVTTTALGVTQNALLTGTFNTSANTSTITTALTSGTPCTTSVNTYRSVADFVDEVRVIPGVLMQTSTTTTNAGACGAGTATVTYTYDSQRRLTTVTSGGSATTYIAWDSSGRPTTGSFPGTTISNVYNDATRTWTQTQTTGGTTSTSTSTFDTNGAQLMIVNTTAGIVSTTTFTNTATAQVCK